MELEPVIRMAMSGDPDPVEVKNKDGAFTFQSVIADKYRVCVAKPPGSYVMSELLYNGSGLPERHRHHQCHRGRTPAWR